VLDNGSGARATPQREVCIAKLMKQAGYATAVAGKWRQLSHFTTKEDGLAWGFDEFLIWGVGSKGERYWDPRTTGTAGGSPTPKASTGPTCCTSS